MAAEFAAMLLSSFYKIKLAKTSSHIQSGKFGTLQVGKVIPAAKPTGERRILFSLFLKISTPSSKNCQAMRALERIRQL